VAIFHGNDPSTGPTSAAPAKTFYPFLVSSQDHVIHVVDVVDDDRGADHREQAPGVVVGAPPVPGRDQRIPHAQRVSLVDRVTLVPFLWSILLTKYVYVRVCTHIE
jgi:hypothetical protein